MKTKEVETKNRLILRINLYVDYTNDTQPLTENHKLFEVIKETDHRLYFKGGGYTNKENIGDVKGTMSVIETADNNYKTIFNSSIYCNPEDEQEYQALLRADFINQVTKMKNQVAKFHKLYAHDDILPSDSDYVVVTKKSEVLI